MDVGRLTLGAPRPGGVRNEKERGRDEGITRRLGLELARGTGRAGGIAPREVRADEAGPELGPELGP
jgi:hypothetical protein